MHGTETFEPEGVSRAIVFHADPHRENESL